MENNATPNHPDVHQLRRTNANPGTPRIRGYTENNVCKDCQHVTAEPFTASHFPNNFHDWSGF
jgi:hypothetical protein